MGRGDTGWEVVVMEGLDGLDGLDERRWYEMNWDKNRFSTANANLVLGER